MRRAPAPIPCRARSVPLGTQPNPPRLPEFSPASTNDDADRHQRGDEDEQQPEHDDGEDEHDERHRRRRLMQRVLDLRADARAAMVLELGHALRLPRRGVVGWLFGGHRHF